MKEVGVLNESLDRFVSKALRYDHYSFVMNVVS